ncbi:MAG: GNAT family N-acetyltransferase [Anaerolineaceae bacterium]|nr:GNAT family N-acetyltransferase [Anaerolineaceae bacterium]
MDCEISRVQAVTAELTEAFERLMPQLSPAPAPAREALEEMLASQVVLLFVARCPPDGRITGALALAVVRVPSGVRAWIEDVVVDQAARRQGIGEALTRAALQAARERGAKVAELTSNPARQAANQLYQRLGFVRPETHFYRYYFDKT